MRVTIDLERDIIIVPDNFFQKIIQENEKIEKFGGKPLAPVERIKKSFEIAMSNTDKRLMTQSIAKTATRTRKPISNNDMQKMLEDEKDKK